MARKKDTVGIVPIIISIISMIVCISVAWGKNEASLDYTTKALEDAEKKDCEIIQMLGVMRSENNKKYELLNKSLGEFKAKQLLNDYRIKTLEGARF